MPRKSYTILILPHARARFRKVHLSHGFVQAVTCVLAGLLVTGLALPHLVFKLRSRSAEVQRLEQDNIALRTEKLRFEEQVGELGRRLGTYEEQTRLLADELGVDDLPALEPAAGGAIELEGVPATEPFQEEFDALRTRAARLERSFEQLDDAWRERERMLASTPSTLPVRGWFSHGFGWRNDPFTGQRAFHRGMDIVAPQGTPVTAPADGVITNAGRLGPYGKRIDISHGYGYTTRYGHLSEVLVKPGQRVRRGDLLGRVGSTGRSTGPHLHYEVFRDGRRVNPWKYLGEKGF